jgi:hypothetical protein
MDGPALSKTEAKPTSSISGRRVGYVGAPATPGFMAHHRKEKKREEKNFWFMVRTWTNWNLGGEPLGTSWP